MASCGDNSKENSVITSSHIVQRKVASVAGILIMVLANSALASMTIVLKLIYNQTNITVYEVTYFRGLTVFLFNLGYAKSINVSLLDIPPALSKQLFGRIVFGILAVTTFYLSNKVLPVSLAAALLATDPIFTAIIGWLIFSEKITKIDIVALFLAFIGVLCIVMNPMRVHTAGQSFTPYFMLFPLLSALACGFVYNYTRQLAQTIHWIVSPAYFGVGVAGFIPILMLMNGSTTSHLTEYSFSVIALMLGMYLLGWLGQLCMSKGLQMEVAGRATVINYIQIVLLFASDVALFHSEINLFDVLGTVLIIGCNFTIGLLKFLNIIQ